MNLASTNFVDAARDPVLSNGTTAEGQENGILPPALLQHWQSVVRWRWIIAGIVLGCLIIGLVVTLLIAPRYTARAQIEISREQKQITNVQGLESNESGRDIEFYATQYSLLVARPVAERIARRLNLFNDEAFFDAHGLNAAEIDEENSRLSEKERRQLRERIVIDELLDNVGIDPVRTSRLVDISYTSRSPELSARITNAWTEAFIKNNMDRQFASTADARRFLEQRLTALRQRLEETERDVITYASDKGIITLAQERDDNNKTQQTRTLAASDLEALNAQLNEAIAARIEAESKVVSRADNTPDAVTNPGLATLRQKRAEVSSDLAKMLVQFEPSYPSARALEGQVRSLDATIARESSRISNSRRQVYAEAFQRETKLREQVKALKNQLDLQQRASIQYSVLQREADTNRQLYDALLQRYKEIGVAGAVGASNISVVEQAEVPIDPSAPSFALNLALALLAGVLLASGTVFALEHIDEGVRDPSQVQPLFGLPLLGHTPLIDEDPVVTLADTKSHFYEANFTVQSNLSFSTSHGFPKSMTVASTRPSEGKSSTALALAVVLGRMDRKVLLVDGDLRSPSVDGLVGGSNQRGFSNYLAGEDDWHQLVQDTRFKGLSVIAAGPIPPSAAELLSGERLHRFVEECLTEFDHLIIDSPPVMGLTDASLLSRAVEGSVFVTQAGGAPIRAVRAAIERLQLAHVHIFGIVLTKLKRHHAGYGYGYGYGHSFEYGRNGETVETA